MLPRARQPRPARLASFVCPLLVALVPGNSALAFEQGMSLYPKSFAGFMSGLIPPNPGLVVGNPIYYAFDASANALVRDGQVELGADISMDAVFVQGLYVTGWQLFGGTYAVGGAVAYAWLDLTAEATGPLGGSAGLALDNNGVADSIIMPVNLSWHSGNWHMNAGVSFYVPTGGYTRNALSIGRNVWAVWPSFAVTWFDMANGWDVSSSFTFVIPGENDATNYQSGVVFHMDWAIGKHFGAWEIGVQGNLVEQFTDDSGSGAQLGGFRMESFGIGPAVSYTAMVRNSPLTINAKWIPDISATNTFEGDVVMASLAFVF